MNNEKKIIKNKALLWIVIAVYAVAVLVVGKGFAERFLVAKAAESYIATIIRQGVDDKTLDEIVKTFISETVGDNLAGYVLSKIIDGDDVNDLYHALVMDMNSHVYAVEKSSDGRYRIGISVANNNNVIVAKATWELIKARYHGNAVDVITQLWNDLNGDISRLVSEYFITAADILVDQGVDITYYRSFVINVNPSSEGDMPIIENKSGYLGFIMTCAGIPMDVGNAPDISDQRKTYGAVLFVLLSAGIVAGIYYKRSVKRTKSPEPLDANHVKDKSLSTVLPSDAGSCKKAILYACSPQHNNMMFALHDTPIFIGRDASNCKVVFLQGAAGVSSKHCAISYDSVTGLFVLTDLRSTYGTFLNGGERLTANKQYYLKPGDSFYIGAPANLFRVDVG